MAHLEMVHTLILRFANMEKWINSLNLSTPIFRTLQYISKISEANGAKSNKIRFVSRAVLLKISLRYCIIKEISILYGTKKNLNVPIPTE